MLNNNVIEVIVKVRDQTIVALNGIKKSLAGLGKFTLLGIGAGVLGTFALFSKILDKLAVQQEAVTQLNATLASTGEVAGWSSKELQDMAAQLQTVTAYGDEAIIKMQSVLLTFTKVRGDTFKEATVAVLDLSSKLGIDLQRSAIMVGKALQDPVLGMQNLRRVGVNFNAENQKTIKGFMAAGQQAEAQKFILKELNVEFGNSAKVMRGTLKGAIDSMHNALGDLLEGDGSFATATKSINDFTTMLQDPKMKASFDVFIGLIVDTTAAIYKYAGAAAVGAVETKNFLSELFGGDGGSTGIELLYKKLNKLKEDRSTDNPFVFGHEKRVAAYDAEIEKVKALITAQQVLNSKSPLYTGAVDKPKPAIEPTDPEEDAKKAAAAAKALAQLRADALQGVAKTAEGWAKQQKLITDALAAGAVSQREAQASMAALTANVRAAVLPEDVTFGADFVDKINLIIAALDRTDITAREAGDAIMALRDGALSEVGPAAYKAAKDWEAAERKIAAAAKNIGMTAEQVKQALKELVDQNLEEIKITATKIVLPPPEDLMAPFRKKMAETLQSTFADAFDGIGEKSGSDVATDFLRAFKRILAEAAAMNLMKVLGLDKIVSGQATNATGIMGKIIGSIFPSQNAATGGRVDPGVDGGIVAGDSCISKCASEVVGTVVQTTSTTMSKTLDGFFADFNKYIKPIFSGLWKLMTGMLTKLWEFIKAAIAAIRAMATTSSATSGGGGIWGAIVQGVAAYFTGGASLAGTAASATGNWSGPRASGGSVTKGRSYLVGEEGPELFMPGMSGMIGNQRQLAFAGGGGGVNYAPTWNIKIEGARDDSSIMQQLAVYVKHQDEKTKAEVYDTMRRNGQGRMRR